MCRQYRADEICVEIEAPTLEERVYRYQRLFGLPTEAGWRSFHNFPVAVCFPMS